MCGGGATIDRRSFSLSAPRSLRATAEALNKAGISSPAGKAWHPTSVSRLLKRLRIEAILG
ncbi:recombinase family protein [Parerythrobacter aurantius]|uniref:recombinase family protein n=1 Tax=Parerythrobacter aurantius TaxID=3127706 RepID=UPI00324E2312